MKISEREIIVVLGSTNSSMGELGSIAKSRLDYCLDIYTQSAYILCTGGWGEHFNTTQTAHAVYARKYLIERGIPEGAFLANALSANSVDDAMKIKQIVSAMTGVKLTVITSDFHIERIKLIYAEILNGFTCNFIGVKSEMDQHELDRLVKHEQQAIASILQNGLFYDT